jgi:hypothetical protein
LQRKVYANTAIQFPIASVPDPRQQARHDRRDIVCHVDQHAQFAVVEFGERSGNGYQINGIAAQGHWHGHGLQRSASSAPYTRIGRAVCSSAGHSGAIGFHWLPLADRQFETKKTWCALPRQHREQPSSHRHLFRYFPMSYRLALGNLDPHM